MNHFTVYHDPKAYAAFPSLAVDPGGAVYCAFRQVPTRRNKTHIDTRSVTVLYKSQDKGESWEKVSEVKIAPYTGNQDPSLAILRDGTFLLNCFGWGGKRHTRKAKKVDILGVYVFESKDRGKTWAHPQHIPLWSFGLQVAVSEPIVEIGIDKDHLLMAGYADIGGGGDACLLFRSINGSWEKGFVKIAHDPTGSLNFQEPSLVDLDGGHLVCLMRVPFDEGSRIYQAHSWDSGDTWEAPRDTKMRGLPPNVIRLRDGRLLCTYGYRKPPYGIRACTSRNGGLTWDIEKEIMLRLDGGGWDIGYPSTVQLEAGELLTAYYWYTKDDKTRRIKVTKWSL